MSNYSKKFQEFSGIFLKILGTLKGKNPFLKKKNFFLFKKTGFREGVWHLRND